MERIEPQAIDRTEPLGRASASRGVLALASEVSDDVRRRHGEDPESIGYGPARVNLIGEHVDNFGGRRTPTKSIPFAIDKQIVLAALRRAGREVELTSLNLESTIRFDLDGLSRPGFALDSGSWARFPQAVALELLERGRELGGFAGSLKGNVPGKGTSSSAALCVCLTETMSDLFDLALEPDDVVEIARAAERRTGVPCGYMDQMASVHGRPGHAVVVKFFREGKPAFERIPMDLGATAIVGIDTGKERDLLTSQYKTRVKECEQALVVFRELLARAGRDEISALAEIAPADLESLGALEALCAFWRDGLSAESRAAIPLESLATLRRRVVHVVGEMQRTDEVERILKSESPEKARRIGAILTACHASLRDNFEVSAPELDFLVERSRAHGAYGARLMGAGEGGNMIFLGAAEEAEEIRSLTIAEYGEAFPARRSAWFECTPSMGAGLIALAGEGSSAANGSRSPAPADRERSGPATAGGARGVSISRSEIEGVPVHVLATEGGETRVAIADRVGGLVMELAVGGRRWLLRNEAISLEARLRGEAVRDPIATTYVDRGDCGLGDTCVVTVGGGPLTLPGGRTIALVDHGYAWFQREGAVRTEVNRTRDGARATTTWRIDEPPFAFDLVRALEVGASGEIAAHFALENRGATPVPDFWSSHDMFALDAETEYRLEAGTQMVVFAASGIEFAEGSHPWPSFHLKDGRTIDLSRPARAHAVLGRDFACKIFTKDPAGPLEVRHGEHGISIAGEGTRAGLWINWGGWIPRSLEGRGVRYQSTCPERCRGGATDLVSEGLDRGTCDWIEPGGHRAWTIRYEPA